MKKLIVFFLFVFTVSVSYADTITYCARSLGTGKCASTKESACDSYLTQSQKDSGSKFLSVEGNFCKYFAFGSEVKLSSYICPDGQSYDGSSCVDGSGGSTPLNCKADEEYPLRSPDAKIVWDDERKIFYVATASPNYACINNCEYTNLHEKYRQKCFLKKGSADIGFCNFGMYSTGASCAENTPSNGKAEAGDPLPTRPDENGGEMGGGDDDKGNENNNDNDQDKDKDKENENNNDNDKDKDKDQGGGGGGGGGEGSDGDSGSSGGSGGSGTGGKDQGGKEEDGGSSGSNNDGSGSGGSGTGEGGEGTCDPSVEECGDGDSEVKGMNCDEQINCKGDAVDCAILEQEKEAWCKAQEFYDTSEKTVKKAQDSLNSELSGSEYQKPEITDNDTHDLKGVFDGISTAGSSGSCPVLPEIVYTVAGYTGSVSTSQAMADFCSYLGFFGSIMVAFALFRGAQIVGEGMG